MRNFKFISSIFALSLLISFSCGEDQSIGPDNFIDIEESRVPPDDGGCVYGQYWDPVLRACVPDDFMEVDNQLAAMGETQVANDIKSMYITIGNQSDIYLALTKAKNKGKINTTQYVHAQNLMDNIFASNNPTEILSVVNNFKASLPNLSLTTTDRERLTIFVDVVDGIIDDVRNDPANAGLSPDGIRDKIFCGLAIASYGVAAAALVTATGGTAAVLLAGVGYSLATASLAACFI